MTVVATPTAGPGFSDREGCAALLCPLGNVPAFQGV